MRPAGEERQAIGRAARELAAERAVRPHLALTSHSLTGGTWREIAQRACVGFDVARRTVENMARAGELQPIGAARVAGSRRPMTVYAPSGFGGPAASLDAVLRGWSSPRG